MELNRRRWLGGLAASVSLTSGCLSGTTGEEPQTEEFTITSGGIEDAGSSKVLNYRHTRQGDNISPPVQLHNVPARCDYVAVLLRDVTGSAEVPLWLLWGRIPTEERLSSGLPKTGYPRDFPTITQGTNASGEVGYSGPDPGREYESRDGGTDSTSIELTSFVFESGLGLSSDVHYPSVIHALNSKDRSSSSLYAKAATNPNNI